MLSRKMKRTKKSRRHKKPWSNESKAIIISALIPAIVEIIKYLLALVKD
ncbi:MULTISPECIES: hypothetical protein [Streptococcus]|uniref:Uncharacterized protein n=1 Tax=Streptococcus pseudopneumoniae TaxID=257758 RepID=A0A2P0A359_9STRE|nr:MULTISPECIES: hypothetical protein [Streptococcus]AEL10499.1 hypothetical protein SPPN_05315 [Streptococcus pseudopneumoniae IS7493]MBF9605641.1 hypothetical protein [Streptococcus pseudopneumoniae]CEY67720.1 Uncharacterised protein [Streptococcus pseudopneumoniae]COC59100.1 Uncharacterised protein [Streptococcus pseudopneumoniae]